MTFTHEWADVWQIEVDCGGVAVGGGDGRPSKAG